MQLASSSDRSDNLDRLNDRIAEAAAAHARFVVFPEATQRAFGVVGEPLASEPEAIDGPFVAALRQAASTHDLTISAGMFEASGDPGRPYNTTVVVCPSGALHIYRKLHLYDALGFVESSGISPGALHPDNVCVVEVDEFRVGIMTCFDLRFPETARLLVDAGAEVIAMGAAWVAGAHKRAQWETLVCARAIESTAYLIAAAQPEPRYTGRSLIVDPEGLLLASGSFDSESILFADFDRTNLKRVRESMPVLQERRIWTGGLR